MLVEMTRLRRLPWSPWPVADLEMEAGRATLPWRGTDDDSPGRYLVGWTIETDLVWGRDAGPATEPEPRVLPRPDHLLVRGRLLDPGVLDVGGSLLIVDIAGAPAAGAWAELRLDPATISVYPYDL